MYSVKSIVPLVLILALGMAGISAAKGQGPGRPATNAAAGVMLIGTVGADNLSGTDRDDALYGREGNDSLNGGAGNDALDGGPGADDLRGGPGADDAATYGASGGVTVTLDDRANDGAPGERDNVHRDVEDLYGGPGDDRLSGSGSRNTLDGAGGRDRLNGAGGEDALFGGAGNDILDARDGHADELDCGPGRDVAVVDGSDQAKRCEWFVDSLPAGRFVLVDVNQHIGLPAGTPRRRGCRGTVRITLSLGRRRLARASAPVSGTCRYQKAFALAEGRVGNAKRVKLVVRFSGNSAVSGDTFTYPRGPRVERLD
jgi:hypothetical protein